MRTSKEAVGDEEVIEVGVCVRVSVRVRVIVRVCVWIDRWMYHKCSHNHLYALKV